jgi:putative CocE/NonD family hydrolase
MRDGVRLAADLYLADGAPRPTVLLRTPYLRRSLSFLAAEIDPLEVARQGYAVVFEDVRGRGESGGQFRAPGSDVIDGADTLRWIRSQPWSDGRVVTAGASYNGVLQLELAAHRPAGLLAMAPAMSGELADIWGLGGSLRVTALTSWVGILVEQALAGPVGSLSRDEAEVLAAYQEADPRERLEAIVSEQSPVHRLAAPVRDWIGLAERSRAVPAAVSTGWESVPSLHATGWFDFCKRATIRAFQAGCERSDAKRHLVVGPWTHSSADAAGADSALDPPMPGLELLRQQLQFFNEVLGLGSDSNAQPLPTVRTYKLGQATWSSHEAWPPPGAAPMTYFLTAHGGNGDGLLSARPALEGALSYVYDPACPAPSVGSAGTVAGRVGPRDHSGALDGRKDVLSFSSEPVVVPLELCGQASAELVVDSTAVDTAFVLHLVVVKPDGRSFNISEGAWDGSLASLAESDHLRGYRTCHVELGDLHVVLSPRDRVRLYVTSSDYPELLPNPNTGARPTSAWNSREVPAHQHLACGGPAGSRLQLPRLS